MRFLLRSLLFWAICLPLFYLFGLPYLLEKLSTKFQQDSFKQCIAHLQNEFHLGTPAATFKQADGEHYCYCISNGLQILKEDLPELVQKQTPARIVAAQKTISDTCNAQLQGLINSTLQAAPPPVIERDEQGREIVHIQ